MSSLTRGQTLRSGIDQTTFDRSVRIQDDLFLHVNGEWLKHTPIPDDKSDFGSFTILADESLLNIRTIIEESAEANSAAGSEAQKVGDFYKSYMNEARAEDLGLDPLRAELKKIENLRSKEDVVRHFGYMEAHGVGSPIGFFVDQDDKNSTQYLAAVIQSGTSLPDRAYYLGEDEKYLASRGALQAYIAKLYQIGGFEGGKVAAEAILTLETKLAEVQWERTQLRDAEKRYNKYAVNELGDLTPQLPWRSFLDSVGVADLEELNIMTPSFFVGVEKIVQGTPLGVWKHYLQFHLVDAYAPALSSEFVDAHFNFHSKALAGIPVQKPRWKRAVETASGGRGFGVLGDAVGKLYVERHFSPDAKARMDTLVNNLLRAFRESIDQLPWMTDETKVRATEKLDKITTKIGYTEKWRDYSKLEIRPDDLVGNLMRSAAVEHDRMIEKLGKPVDRTEWGMTPQTVNAYYNPSMNEIVFPAAILQPPFFDAEADDAVNYGGIGAVIGHEISHAFDDQGSRYDANGNLKNWWTDHDRAAFKQLTSKLVAQYESYSPLPEQHVNGQLTLGENIADLSGMAIAFKAYRLALDGRPAPVIDGWTGDQRFFIGWAQVWRRKYRDAEMVRRLLTDPHSPSAYRANGPLTNLTAFYEAFDVTEGDRLFKPAADRIQIW
jgi:predicted metalloendopeptidase